MTKMKDVARLADVSIATVSATLSGAAFVSPALKERVQAAVRTLGYAPNSVASGLRKGTTSLLGLIVPDITNPFFTALIHAVQRRARDLGYSVLLCDSEQDVTQELAALRLMQTHRAAGTVLCPTGAAQDYEALAGSIGSMVLVTVDHRLPGDDFDSVMLDNRVAARLATDHIVQNGHRRIGMIGGPRHLQQAEDRFRGFAEALGKAGLPVDDALVREAGFREDEAFEACKSLLAGSTRPTALFVANNQMLIGVMRAIAAAGLDCPADISVAAIDDFPWAAAFTPALTTVRQPVDAMAEAAMTMLVDRLSGARTAVGAVVLAPELIIRNSCVPVPKAPRATRVARVSA